MQQTQYTIVLYLITCATFPIHVSDSAFHKKTPGENRLQTLEKRYEELSDACEKLLTQHTNKVNALSSHNAKGFSVKRKNLFNKQIKSLRDMSNEIVNYNDTIQESVGFELVNNFSRPITKHYCMLLGPILSKHVKATAYDNADTKTTNKRLLQEVSQYYTLAQNYENHSLTDIQNAFIQHHVQTSSHPHTHSMCGFSEVYNLIRHPNWDVSERISYGDHLQQAITGCKDALEKLQKLTETDINNFYNVQAYLDDIKYKSNATMSKITQLRNACKEAEAYSAPAYHAPREYLSEDALDIEIGSSVSEPAYTTPNTDGTDIHLNPTTCVTVSYVLMSDAWKTMRTWLFRKLQEIKQDKEEQKQPRTSLQDLSEKQTELEQYEKTLADFLKLLRIRYHKVATEDLRALQRTYDVLAKSEALQNKILKNAIQKGKVEIGLQNKN